LNGEFGFMLDVPGSYLRNQETMYAPVSQGFTGVEMYDFVETRWNDE
jgi:hypothetical protein